jgi:hypothetical protein
MNNSLFFILIKNEGGRAVTSVDLSVIVLISMEELDFASHVS